MKAFFIRWLVTTIAVFAAVEVIPGIECANWVTLAAAALILGIINAVVKPALVLLTLPLVVVTLGLFIPIINAFLLWVTSLLVPDFHVTGFWSAVLGGIVISIVSGVINAFVRRDGRTTFIYRGVARPPRDKLRGEKVIDV